MYPLLVVAFMLAGPLVATGPAHAAGTPEQIPTSTANAYWTAVTDHHQLGASAAWYVFFHDGFLAVVLKTDVLYARAVRGGL